MLKRIFAIVVLVIVYIRPLSIVSIATDNLALSADSAILMNADTGEVVYEKNSHKKRGIASTTKIMTSVLLIENKALSEEVAVTDEDVRIEGTSVGLKAGDVVSCDTLLKAMLLESGNDAANVTATAVSGSKEAFATLMNEKAKALGMKNSSFKNPSGLTEEEHFSTAYDMALLTRYAISIPDFIRVCSLKQVRVSYGTPSCERVYINHNKLLDSYDGVFGVKTGFTKASGRCLVSACERNGVTLIAVTLKAPDDWSDHKKMYDYGFEKTVKRTVDFDSSNVNLRVVGSDKKMIKAKLSSDLIYFSAKEIETQTIVYCEHFLYADINRGDIVGRVEVRDNDNKTLCKSYLVSMEDAAVNFAPKDKPFTLLEKLKNYKILE